MEVWRLVGARDVDVVRGAVVEVAGGAAVVEVEGGVVEAAGAFALVLVALVLAGFEVADAVAVVLVAFELAGFEVADAVAVVLVAFELAGVVSESGVDPDDGLWTRNAVRPEAVSCGVSFGMTASAVAVSTTAEASTALPADVEHAATDVAVVTSNTNMQSRLLQNEIKNAPLRSPE